VKWQFVGFKNLNLEALLKSLHILIRAKKIMKADKGCLLGMPSNDLDTDSGQKFESEVDSEKVVSASLPSGSYDGSQDRNVVELFPMSALLLVLEASSQT
jgi:hypothetical protein